MNITSTLNIETATRILTLLSSNPGLTKTAIFQKLSLIPIKCNAYIIFFVKEGLIGLLDGTYTITERGVSELKLSTEPAPNQIAPISDEQELSKEKHTETIICPECNGIQEAEVLHTFPYATYIHDCIHCGYTIMESEWNKVTDKTVADTPIIVTSATDERYAIMKQKLKNLSLKIK